MNKFMILALLACVANVLAVEFHDAAINEINDAPSQFALFEDDETETAGLPENKKVFRDLCLAIRDNVKVQIKSKINEHAGDGFKLIMEAIEDISRALTDSDAKELEKNIALVQADIGNIKSAVSNVLWNIRTEVQEKVLGMIAQARSQMNIETLMEMADKTCLFITQELRGDIVNRLTQEKRALRSKSKDKSFLALIDEIKFENLGCATTNRVNNLTFLCRIFTSVGTLLRSSFNKN